jgi:hypothetical protein
MQKKYRDATNFKEQPGNDCSFISEILPDVLVLNIVLTR